jgi:hypothetical protein
VCPSSRPTRNMYRTTPSCATTPRNGATSDGRIRTESSGAKCPNKDGPRTIPPRISPMTAGCPTERRNHPNSRPVMMTAVSATKTRRSALGVAIAAELAIVSGVAGDGAVIVSP